MAVAGRRWSLRRLHHLPLARETPEGRERERLARAVREYARADRELSHRASVVELDSIASRTALFEALAQRLEDPKRPIASSGLDRVSALLADPAPFRDYGPRAHARNERIADLLEALEPPATDDDAPP
jgi:hypothetical protein